MENKPLSEKMICTPDIKHVKEAVEKLKGSINQIPIPNSREVQIMTLVHECIDKIFGEFK